MSVKNEYLTFKSDQGLKTGRFEDRVLLQKFLRDRIEDIWGEKPQFSNGGLLKNHMTGFAIGFAYYDCRPTAFRAIPGTCGPAASPAQRRSVPS